MILRAAFGQITFKLRMWLHVWQLPLVALFIAGWILGGAWLLRRAARKSPSAKVRRTTFVRWCQLSFLSGAFGMGGAVVVLCIFIALSKITALPLMRVGAVVAAVLGVLLAWLVFFASLPVTGRQSLALAAKPMGAVVVLAALLGTLAYFPALSHIRENYHYYRTVLNLIDIRRALNAYHRECGVMPDRLQQLVDARLAEPDVLASGVNPHLPVGYFYVSPGRKKADPTPIQIVAVSFLSEQHPNCRAVLFVDGDLKWFQAVEGDLFLAKEVNADFAAALRQAEANLPPPPRD